MTLELLVESAVRALVFGAATWLALFLIRIRNPHVHKLVWRLVLVAGLALPALLYWRLAPSFAMSLYLPVLVGTGAGSVDALAAGVVRGAPLAKVLSAIYLGVMLVLIIRLVAGLAGMWRICRGASRLDMADDVRISARVRSPATFGSIILLPAAAREWSADTFEAVLAHERAHVRARDCHWSWLAQFHVAMFWFSPLSWWLHRRLDMLAETTSDDAVLAALHDPIDYAALLLDFARNPNSRRVAMSAAESNVPARIERLLARTPPAAALPRAARWTAFVLLIPATMLAASTTYATPPAGNASPVAAKAAVTLPDSQAEVRLRNFPNPDDFYPTAALQQGVTGKVVVKVAVDAGGNPIDVQVIDVQPASPEYGFAAAAIEVARRSTYTNPRQEVSYLKFMVKFSL